MRVEDREWQALERRDPQRQTRILNLRGTVSSSEIVELAMTRASRRTIRAPKRLLKVTGQ
jgi:hypothetical protein